VSIHRISESFPLKPSLVLVIAKIGRTVTNYRR
jgi:hypothetical protein